MVLTTFGGCSAKKSDSDIGVYYEVEEESVEKLINDEQQKTLESYSSSLESSNLNLMQITDELLDTSFGDASNTADDISLDDLEKIVNNDKEILTKWSDSQDKIIDGLSDKISEESYKLLSERKEELNKKISDNLIYTASEVGDIKEAYASGNTSLATEKLRGLKEHLDTTDFSAYGKDTGDNGASAGESGSDKTNTDGSNDNNESDELLEYFYYEFDTPLEAYYYLKNNIHTEFYYGTRKNPIATYEGCAGNDYDQALLLGTVLKSEGYEVKYVKGTIRLKPEKVLSMTGAKDIEQAADIFAMAGIPVTKLRAKDGSIKVVEVEHVWVRANIPYTDYRGAGSAAGKSVWLDLDTSIKDYEDAENLYDYIESTDNKDELRAILNASSIDDKVSGLKSYTSARTENAEFKEKTLYNRKRKIKETENAYLPLSLQYEVSKEIEVTEKLSISDSVNISIAGENLGNYTAAYLSDKSVVVSFVPATESDKEIIDAYGGIFNVPAGYVYVKPALFIDNEKVSECEVAEFNLGAATTMEIDLSFVGNVPEKSKNISNKCIAGSTYAVTFDTQSMGPYESWNSYLNLYHYKDKVNENNVFDREKLGALLSYTGKLYFAQVDAENVLTSETMDIVDVRRLSEAVTGYEVRKNSSYGVVTKLSYGNLFIDVDAEDHYVKSKVGDKNKEFLYRFYEGLTGSKYEGIIWAEGSKDKTKETVCTVTVLNHALQNGIEIHQFDKENKEGLEETLAKLSLSDSERSRIKQDIEAGHLITIPDEDVTIGSWTGTGYISLDKATGAGAYMISGSLNGGAKPVIATGMAIYALFMELGSAYFLINALSLVLVPGIIKLAGVALIMQGIYVINMMLIAYIDYMATYDEAYFDQFVNWFLKSGLISSIQLECAYLLLSLFWVAEAWDDEKEENNSEVETNPETTPETNQEATPETNIEATPETTPLSGQTGGDEGNVGEGGTNYEITWNKSIKATQETIEGTNIPKSFIINGLYVNGKEVWVHGNATKHMGEYVNSANGSQLVENELMISFQDAVAQILPKVQPGRNFFYINGWEIGINGDTGVIYHALYK